MDRNKLYSQIHGFAKALGKSEEELRSIYLRKTGNCSKTVCTVEELQRIVDYLKLEKDITALQNKGASPAQLKKIVALGYAMDWNKDDNGNYLKGLLDKRLNGLCSKQYKVSSYKWLDKEGAWAFIETLKKLKARKDKVTSSGNQPSQDNQTNPQNQSIQSDQQKQQKQLNQNKLAVSAT